MAHGTLTPIIGLRLLALAAGLRHNAGIGQPGLCFSAYGHKFGINHLGGAVPRFCNTGESVEIPLGHSRIDTTQLYTDEIELDDLAAALDQAAARRHAQASPDPTTLEAELTDELERLRWRRRESNPRNSSAALTGCARAVRVRR
jgi:hypothetical protein